MLVGLAAVHIYTRFPKEITTKRATYRPGLIFYIIVKKTNTISWKTYFDKTQKSNMNEFNFKPHKYMFI